MSLKQEIETWVTALAAYDNNEFDNALKCFGTIADTSKILFNIGVIHATLGEHSKAVGCYQRAVHLDQYLAVAYFQQGVSNFLTGDFEEGLANFNDTLLYLRGNNNIDYEQLGLKFKLYSCEVLFNRGLCYIYLQQKDAGMQDLIFAAREKGVADHDVIDEAIREQAEGYTVFSIPVGVVYRPNEAKVKNLKTKNYLGKARLVAAQEQHQTDPRRAAALAAMGIDDRPGEKLSYAALNLVRPDLTSRSRLQSEPPMHRSVFPPTPPPELDERRPSSSQSKRKSLESVHSTHSASSGIQSNRPAAKPLRLELGAAAFEQKTASSQKPRLGTKRSESERPAMRREYSNEFTKTYESIRRRGNSRRHREMEERHSPHALPEVQVTEDPIEAYSQQVQQISPASTYNSQISPQSTSSAHQRSRSSGHTLRQPNAIEEEDEEDGSDPYDSMSPLAFEIVPPRPSQHQRRRSHSRRAPEIRKIRIKVHAAEDMRYVMSTPTVRYEELTDQIRQKFGVKGGLKLKIKDDGDLVTLADQEDLDMLISSCKAAAAKEKADMGKMEIWLQEVP